MPTVERAEGFRLIAPDGQFELSELPPLTPSSGEVVVEVAGCGLCHTDVGFAYDGVPTRKALPIILGHEISGRVVAVGSDVSLDHGSAVIVPAVIPCGTCGACQAGRPTICRNQFMPGNDGDGGFATHVIVPARALCAVPSELPAGVTLEMLSVVADAVTTPYEAIARAGVGPEDVGVVVGAGGIGSFGVQIAAALGASVVAIDIDDQRLELAAAHGAALTLNAKSSGLKEIRGAVRDFARREKKGTLGLKIFEMSGTTAGQETAFGLLDFGGYLAVVGFTPDKVTLRLSNLMAFDATARGNWGCAPERYPDALRLVLEGKVKIGPFVESYQLNDLPELMIAAHRHELRHRPIVVPHGKESS